MGDPLPLASKRALISMSPFVEEARKLPTSSRSTSGASTLQKNHGQEVSDPASIFLMGTYFLYKYEQVIETHFE
jgi:hypothetical protein